MASFNSPLSPALAACVSLVAFPALQTVDKHLTMESHTPPSISSWLMSPPEATPYDSFLRHDSPKMSKPARALLSRDRFPMSPPVSPDGKTNTRDDLAVHALRDPILYPPITPNVAHAPLFADAEPAGVYEKVVEEHVAARPSSLFSAASPPRKRDYQLALEFKSQVARRFNQDRLAWLRREKAFLAQDRALVHGTRRYSTIAPAPASRSHRMSVSQVAKPVIIKAKAKPRPVRPVGYEGAGSLLAEPKRVAREDRDYASLPDYTPPVSSLPNRPNSLKVEWKGAPISLAGDPQLHLLHPDEALLAANLRLDCATYLTSKRRIFIGRLECLRKGKEFRKTDAQQACKIDVNKASKLWMAFDKVGWLNRAWMAEFV